jgi:predicted transposase YbfD/YdcC
MQGMKKDSEVNQIEELIECLKFIEDPRVLGRSKHLLIDILVISICAVLCGAEGVFDIEEFGLEKEDWLRRFLSLPCGIPSHDTIARVLSLIDPIEMEKAFQEWVRNILGKDKIKSISLDGKSTRGTERTFNQGKKGLHMVSAYSHELGLTLMEVESEGRGAAEGPAAVECLNSLDLRNVMVLGDAGLATKRVVHKIREKEGDYLVPIKGNQRFYLRELEELFLSQREFIKIASDNNQEHGRTEERSCKILSTEGLSEKFRCQWLDAKVVFVIERVRHEKDRRYLIQKTGLDGKQSYERNDQDIKTTKETTYYVSSRKLSAKEALAEARKHWGIENQLHWVLDVAFGEDDWTVRSKALARSLSLIRKIAFNILKSSKTRGSVRIRMKKAGWNNKFLEQLIFGGEL